MAAGNKVIRIGPGGDLPVREDTEEMIKPLSKGHDNFWHWEIMERADTTSITEADVVQMHDLLAAKGLEFTDAGPDQLGRVEGKLLVLDPGGIRPIEPREPSRKVPTIWQRVKPS